MADKKATGKSKRSSRLLTFLLVVFSAIFIGSGFMIAKELLQREKEKSAFEQMNRELVQAVEDAQSEEKNAEELVLEHYAKIKEQNKDFVAWILIPGTPLSYPVMHTPDDIEYYLRRAFDGSYSVSGTPFLGEGCDVDSTNVLIYGHRMNNDTMFTPLLNYAQKDFWEDHREICFDTVDRLQTYEVVAAFYIEIPLENDPTAFRWYNYGGNMEGEALGEYAKQIKAHAYYDTGVEINKGDKLITLTTCAYNNETHRFVVVARLRQQGETQ